MLVTDLTIEELNKLPTSQVALLMIKCLHTSDHFTTTYQLLPRQVLEELKTVLLDLLLGDRTDNLITEEELRNGVKLLNKMRQV